jgi:hypothetical protein
VQIYATGVFSGNQMSHQVLWVLAQQQAMNDPSQIPLSETGAVDQSSSLQNNMELSMAIEEAERAKIAAKKAVVEAQRA